MDIKTVLELAGGRPAVSKACKVTRQAIHLWINNDRLPLSEITGRTNYAKVIAGMAQKNGHNIRPLDICPGAGQYMQQPTERAAQGEGASPRRWPGP